MTRRKADVLEEQREKIAARIRRAPKGETLRLQGEMRVLTTLALKAEVRGRG